VSLGKTEVVTPNSAPMFVIVARAGTPKVDTPGPPYSSTRPTLPFVPKRASTVRITSFADTPGRNAPVKNTRVTFGQVR